MEIIGVDYTGYITIDKDDLVVEEINSKTGETVGVDIKGMDTKELLKAIKRGDYYVNLEKSKLQALDGDETIDVGLEEID